MKLIYINEKGISIEIKYSYPYFFQTILGEDGLKSEISTYTNYNQDGCFINNQKLAYRDIEITGILRGDTKEEELIKREKLLKVFNPKLKGKLIYENGNMKRLIECVVEEGPKFSARNVYKQKNFIISLLCPNPYWKDFYEGNEIVSTWIGGWKFKFKLPFRFKQRGESRKNIYNEGHVETPVEIIFKGPAVNPCVINHATGEFIKVERTLTTDDTLYITTEFGNKKVEIERNGVRNNAFNYIDLDSTFFQLKVGDNMIEYTTDNDLEPQSVEIRYRNRYLGV